MKIIFRIFIITIALIFFFAFVGYLFDDTATDQDNGDQLQNNGQMTIAEVSNISIGYLSEADYKNGNYSAESIMPNAVFDNGEIQYMVLDLKIRVLADNNGSESIKILTYMSNRGFLSAKIEDAPTGKIEEVLINNAYQLTALYNIPSQKNEEKNIRMIVKLVPISEGEADIRIDMSCINGSFLNGTTHYTQSFHSSTPTLKYVLNSDKKSYSVSGLYHNEWMHIVIPETLGDGLPVIGINDSAFQACTNLTVIEIPAGVTGIGAFAFSECQNLSEIHYNGTIAQWETISKGLDWNASAGNYTVYCTDGMVSYDSTITPYSGGLSFTANDNGTYTVSGIGTCKDTDIVIPLTYNGGAVTGIGSSAFRNCTDLTSFMIPGSVINIDPSAFFGCTKLTEIIVTDSNQNYCSVNGILFHKNGTKIIYYPAGKTESSYTIPDGVTGIENFAFNHCTNLTRLDIPNSVTSIGASAFLSCENLLEIHYNGTAAQWNEIEKGSDWNQSTGNYTVYCTDSTISKDGVVTIISELSFTANGDGTYTVSGIGTYKDTDIIIPATYNGGAVTSIGRYAFYNCESLTSIVIPDSVTSIDEYAFNHCTSLNNVVINGSVTDIVIPDGVTSIGSSAFEYCTSLTSIALPDGVTSIGNSAFNYCYNLKSIVIPDGVTSIGASAFFDCTSLLNIKLSNSLTSIGDYAFGNCWILKSITLPDSVTSIGDYAFYDCRSLTSIVIPDGVTSIGEGAFEYCRSLTSIVISDSVTSIGEGAFQYCESLTSIVIPDSVTSIGDFAFGYCYRLQEITVGDGNQHYCDLGGVLFNKDVTELICYPARKTETTYTIPDSVTSIGGAAFEYCESLTSIVIPDGVTSIGQEAFSGCTSLTSIVIPDGVTSIGYEAFCNCQKLTEIHYSGTTAQWQNISKGANWHYSTPDYTIYCTDGTITKGGVVTPAGTYSEGLSFTQNADGTYTVSGIGTCKDTDILIPPTYNGGAVTGIGNSAFYYCSSVTSIVIPDSVTSIGYSAFADCLYLTSVVLPNGLTSIGESAFGSCTRLTSVEIPDTVTSIGNSAFSHCRSLITVVIPDGVTSVGTGVFNGCKGLTSIELPDGLTSIGHHTFYNCMNLTSIEIPDGVTSIGYAAFYNCLSLTSIVIPDHVMSIGDYAFYNCSGLTNIKIPALVTTIGNSAFYYCTGLTSVEIPAAVTSIGEYAFYYCTNLTEIRYGETTSHWKNILKKGANWSINTGEYTIYCTDGTISKDGVVTPFVTYSEGLSFTQNADGTYTVSGIGTCKDTDILIPPTYKGAAVTSIGDAAFSSCTSLTSIVIPDSVTSIGNSAFRYCTSLTSIVIPDSATSIGNSAFLYCTSLTNVIIPNGVTSIGEKAFSNCTSLTSIKIPNSVINIDKRTFYKCTNLMSIELSYGVTSIGEEAFSNCTSLTSIAIPDSVTSIGNMAFSNCTSLTSIEIPGSVTNIGNQTFYYCENLTRVVIFGGVESIGHSAFYYCSSLTSIAIPDSVTSIGNMAFSNCTSLTNIELPNGLTSIGGDMFFGCTGLTSIKLPDGLTSIGMSAFYGCTGLTSIILPESVTSIVDQAFYNCSSLTSIVIPGSVKSIGNYAFKECLNLNAIRYNGTMAQWQEISKGTDWNTSTGEYTIYCTDGTIAKDGTVAPLEPAVTYSKGLSFIKNSNGTYTVSGIGTCKDTDILIPPTYKGAAVTSIGDAAFSSCTSLTSIVIPDSVTSIGMSAFYNCDSLTSIVLPDSITSIGDGAFMHSSNLMAIRFSDHVTSIGMQAFYYCTSLSEIHYSGTMSQWEKITKGSRWNYSTSDYMIYCSDGMNHKNGATILYSQGLLFSENNDGTYTLTGFSDTTNKNIVIPSTYRGGAVTGIADSAFRNFFTLTSIMIPKSVTGIGDGAFYYCLKLTEIHYTGTTAQWQEITKGSGWNTNTAEYTIHCTNGTISNLDAVTPFSTGLSFSANGDGTYTLTGLGTCTDTNIVIPSAYYGGTVTGIGNSAFSSCTSLKSIVIPDSVTSIGNWAFMFCSNLTAIRYRGTIAQWQAIAKGIDWKVGMNGTIYCTDGTAA